MIVCSCRAVSERELRQAVEAGRSLADVVRLTGATADCGCCTAAVERIFSARRPCRATPCPGCRSAGHAAQAGSLAAA